jgi:hypothetical protein
MTILNVNELNTPIKRAGFTNVGREKNQEQTKTVL